VNDVLGFLGALLNGLNEPFVKTVLAAVGGWIINAHPKLVTKSIPFVLSAGSIALTLGQVLTAAANAMFPGYDAHTGSYIAAVAAQTGHATPLGALWGFILATVVPPVVAVGMHSLPKNLREWLRDGAKFVVKNDPE